MTTVDRALADRHGNHYREAWFDRTDLIGIVAAEPVRLRRMTTPTSAASPRWKARAAGAAYLITFLSGGLACSRAVD